MERYDSYKDSGVDWIGQIPEHWEVQRLASYFDERRVKVSDKEYPALSVTKNGICGQLENVAKTDNGDNRKLVLDGDFVINSRSDRKGSSGLSSLCGSVSLINIVLAPRKHLLIGQFAHFLLKSHYFIEEYYRNGRGIVADLWTTRYSEMKLIKLAIPPISEQQAIAAYLDVETGKLDAAVEKLERMVEVLKERKQLIISKAVTRGLDDSAPLKDSGVEWIGQIPEHWSINRFKAIFTLTTGISFTKADLVENGQPVISYGQVHSKLNKVAKANLSLIKYIPQPLTIGKQKSYCLPNDFIFADTSEDFEGCGNNFYNDSELSVFAGSHTILAKLRCNIEGKYLAYLFSTSLWRQQIRSRVNGVKVFSITQSILKATSVILPPLSEQQAIADYLDDKVGKLDEAIEKQLRMIELLKERKQILISDVVTGKIKVA